MSRISGYASGPRDPPNTSTLRHKVAVEASVGIVAARRSSKRAPRSRPRGTAPTASAGSHPPAGFPRRATPCAACGRSARRRRVVLRRVVPAGECREVEVPCTEIAASSTAAGATGTRRYATRVGTSRTAAWRAQRARRPCVGPHAVGRPAHALGLDRIRAVVELGEGAARAGSRCSARSSTGHSSSRAERRARLRVVVHQRLAHEHQRRAVVHGAPSGPTWASCRGSRTRIRQAASARTPAPSARIASTSSSG